MIYEHLRSPRLRGLIAGTVAVIALGACSSSPREHSAVGKSPTTTTEVSTTIDIKPNLDVIADAVEPSETGSLQDSALNIVGYVNDTLPEYDTVELIAKVRSDIQRIPNQGVRADAEHLVDANLATTTVYADQGYSSYSAESIKDNAESAVIDEGVVDQIVDPNLKLAADKNLDYEQAQAALDALTGYTPEPEIGAALLGYVEDQSVKKLVQKVVGGDEAAKDEFDKLRRKSSEEIEKIARDAFSKLYNGSNFQAITINQSITDFNKARQQNG